MKLLTQMLRNEAGQALPMALILMLLGGFLVVPLLALTTTNLNATRVIDQKTLDIYAADAGDEEGLWKVRYDFLPDWLLGEGPAKTWTEATYAHDPYSYVLFDSNEPTETVTVNNRSVGVDIKPLWVLERLETPSPQQGRTPDDRLLTFGSLIGESADKTKGNYEVSIMYDGSLGALQIQRIGCWLPPGFNYVAGSSNLEKASGLPHCVPQTSPHNGGTAVTWTYAGIDYNNLPAQGNKRIVTFDFTPNEDPTDFFSWTRTSRTQDIYLSWDTSKKVFEISSEAPNDSEKHTTVVSHNIKKEFQALGSAIAGDYRATGITLMRDHNNTSNDERERLYKETSATIKSKTEDPTNGIPDDATVERIFLYWSGWKCKPWRAWNLTDAQLNALPAQKYVNKVALKVKVGAVTLNTTVTATAPPQVKRNGTSSSQHGWSYSCFADVTNLVTDYFKGQNVPFYGNATYTVGHWDFNTRYNSSTYRYYLYNWIVPHTGDTVAGYTRYPLGSPKDGGASDTGTTEDTGAEDQWSYAAWSVVVIYSSPSTPGHHLYVFDQFLYCDNNQTLNFTIKGFLAPEDVWDNLEAARVTCFVGEGDSIWPNDYFQVNGASLPTSPDGVNPQNNVWNSMSNVLGGAGVDGVDIDKFTVSGPSHIIKPADTEAAVRMPTADDSWNLVYLILSFYSEIITGGTIDYDIE
jgi:hypothetical protein